MLIKVVIDLIVLLPIRFYITMYILKHIQASELVMFLFYIQFPFYILFHYVTKYYRKKI